MYPFFRMIKELVKYRKAAPLALDGVHVSHHRCMPWDIDMFLELNNGRTLTLYDLGRLPFAQRAGLFAALKSEKWGMTMAGATVRYRRRIRTFERFEMRSHMVCWDDRFIYIEQSMWLENGECANHIVYRAALTDRNGIVSPSRVAKVLGVDDTSPPIPAYIAKWIEAEDARPWPPMQDLTT
ncbi:thioeseterase [Litorivita pollutaquae]|uniref:Thioeseterase n=1 Tax=Litorivita pollutaquae TaxID=2200892 RepID=A0A2V4MPC5_9RHOB|nr:acyl-CoA thioesterase [Litorivita pollutaquae]PYC47399.1 thioeseterase [Litorivita pollutaquae]